jgi:hypothetical protein
MRELKLIDLINELTEMTRKGPAVVERDAGPVHVTEVFAMPHENAAAPDAIKVDVHFATVVVDPIAKQRRGEVIAAIESSGIDIARLRDGPSYIEIGAALGDQGLALRLFGLGEVAGLWRVITPARFGLTGNDADSAAGNGYIMVSGYHP